MEKESKIQVEQKQRSRCFSLQAICALLFGYVSYNILSGLEYIPKIRLRPRPPTYTETKKPKETIFAEPHHKRWMPAESLPELELIVHKLDEEVRAIKKTGVIMETDPASIQKTSALQKATRNLLRAKYGDHHAYRVKMDLEFPPSMPDFASKGKEGTLVLEMAPIELQPVSVFNFLEIARTWIRGSFHRNADDVLQVQTVSDAIHKPLAFQEYSSQFPHVKGTTGYAGRPSGPGWYISIKDNTEAHGPGSQQRHNPYEADANFGKVVQGMDDVVPRIHSIEQTGWLKATNQVNILKMTILIPESEASDKFKAWIDWTK